MEFTKSSSRVMECVFAAMTDEAAIDVMEALNACRCCLRRAPDKGLNTPHTHEGTTEIYSDMIKECFSINLTEGGDMSPGICDACVDRLRDASAFKTQVQSSQEELKARMEKALQAIDEEPMVKPEFPDDDEMRDILHEEVQIKSEGDDEPSEDHMLYLENADVSEASDEDCLSHAKQRVKPEVSDDSASEQDCISLSSACASSTSTASMSTRLREQLALTCSVKLERLRSDEAPHASQKILATSYHEPRRTIRIEEEPVLTAEVRVQEQVNTHNTCRTQFTNKSKLISRIDENITHTQTHTDKTAYCSNLSIEQITSNSYLIRQIGTQEHPTHTCGNLTFVNSILLNRRHHIEKLQTTCGESQKRFPTISALIGHERIDSGIKSYRCKICNMLFTQKCHLHIHERTHSGLKPYNCKQCNIRFASKSVLLLHERIHSGIKSYRCKTCNQAFTRKSTLQLHESTHSRVKSYKCTKCDKQFANKLNLNRHTVRIHSAIKPIHIHERSYKCTKCDKQFANKRNLNRHTVRIHSAIKPIHIHERSHSGAKPYKCAKCNKQFALKNYLYKHERIHSGIKPYRCKTCNQSFTQKVTLQQHESTHSGVKPYKCTKCDKQFANKRNLNRHTVRIHSEIKPYRCKTCNLPFTQKTSLRIHESTHGIKPYRCKTCNLPFKLKWNLQTHERSHSDVKPYKCVKCSKQFAQNSNLRVHEGTHGRVQPYKCQECNEQFTHKWCLDKHASNQHGKEEDYIEFTQKENIVTYERRTKKQKFSCN